METDASLLLALLALRLLGGDNVPAADLLLKVLKTPLKTARDKGLVHESKAPLSVTSKTGKTSTKQVAVVGLTPQGAEYLRRAASPEAIAATSSGLAAGLRQALEADRQQLRAEAQAALGSSGKGAASAKLQKDMETLAKSVAAMNEKLAKLEKALQPTGGAAETTRVEQVYESMLKRLDSLQAAWADGSHQVPAAPSTHPPTADWHDDVIRMAADQRQKNPFQRLTLPQVFEHLKAKHPHLTLGSFHDGLRQLAQAKRIRLGPYTQALATLDDARNALYLDREVKYYVEPA